MIQSCVMSKNLINRQIQVREEGQAKIAIVRAVYVGDSDNLMRSCLRLVAEFDDGYLCDVEAKDLFLLPFKS